MLNQCSHKFLWPQRSPDGHYYQACLLCRTEYEYDWESMQRVRRQDMGSAVVISTEIGSTDTAGTEDARTATAVAPDPEPEISVLEAVVHSDGAQVVSRIALEPLLPGCCLKRNNGTGFSFGTWSTCIATGRCPRPRPPPRRDLSGTTFSSLPACRGDGLPSRCWAT